MILYRIRKEEIRMSKQTAVIVGAGPGLGYSLAETYWKMYQERSQCKVRFEKRTEGSL